MDELIPENITRSLTTRFVGQNIVFLPKITSTMDGARVEAQKKAPEGTVVIAGEQTAGRGRLNRIWMSPIGSLAFSVILYPPLAQLPQLVMIGSLAVLRSIKEVTGLQCRIKWPNDVLIGGKKVCGILIENMVRGSKVEYADIGIGINVNCDLSENNGLQAMTSLSAELHRDVSRLELTRRLLNNIEELYLASQEKVFSGWRDNLVTLGKTVRVSSGKMVDEGIAESVSSDGTLILRHPDGSLVNVSVGDVSLRNK